MAFTYLHGDPVVSMFHEDTLIVIPREVLEIALEQGWGEGVEKN